MKIVIAGKNNIAVDVAKYILDKYFDNDLYVIFNQNDDGYDGFQQSFKKFSLERNLNNIDLSSAYKMENMIFLSLEFDKIICPSKFLSKNLYNIHFSNLPSYKGMYTSAWPILNNERESGVTIHHIDAGIDTGNIIYKKLFNIESSETAKSLYSKYIEHGTFLVIDNLRDIINNNFVSHPQGSENSSYFSKSSIDYNCITIDMNKTAIEVKKQIDAFTFREYQIVNLFGFDVFGAEILTEKTFVKPGTIIAENDLFFIIATVDFDLKVYIDNFVELMDCCRFESTDKVAKLINCYNINEKNSVGWSPIIVAAYHGNLGVVKYLLERGANINDRNYKGTNVFMYAKDYALTHGDKEYLRELISLGADPYLKDNKGFDVFDYVLEQKNIDSINFMSEFK